LIFAQQTASYLLLSGRRSALPVTLATEARSCVITIVGCMREERVPEAGIGSVPRRLKGGCLGARESEHPVKAWAVGPA